MIHERRRDKVAQLEQHIRRCKLLLAPERYILDALAGRVRLVFDDELSGVDPADIVVTRMHFSHEYAGFLLAIHHEDFDVVEDGKTIPIVVPSWEVDDWIPASQPPLEKGVYLVTYVQRDPTEGNVVGAPAIAQAWHRGGNWYRAGNNEPLSVIAYRSQGSAYIELREVADGEE